MFITRSHSAASSSMYGTGELTPATLARAKIFDELLHEHIGLVPVRDQLRNPLGGDIQETRSGLGAEFSRRDQVGEDLWGREAFRESGLQRFVAEVVDVQASHICDGERAEERQPEPKGGA